MWPLPHCLPSVTGTLASLGFPLVPEHTHFAPTSGPLHFLFPLSGHSSLWIPGGWISLMIQVLAKTLPPYRIVLRTLIKSNYPVTGHHIILF